MDFYKKFLFSKTSEPTTTSPTTSNPTTTIPTTPDPLTSEPTIAHYITYDNQNCQSQGGGPDNDLLRAFPGNVEECKAKCTELDCECFIRVHSNGKCYFRGGSPIIYPQPWPNGGRSSYVRTSFENRNKFIKMLLILLLI